MNTVPRSETTPSGGPYRSSISVWNSSASLTDVIVVLVGRKVTYLVNRSTITSIAFAILPLCYTGRKLVMKSMETS